MNILPLVLGFLLILSFFSSSFLHERIATAWETKALFGHFQADRAACNKVEQRTYRNQKTGNKRKKEKSASSSRNYVSRREAPATNSLSKLNLASLKPSSFPYEVAASLLRTLYPTFKETHSLDWEYSMLNAFIEKAQAGAQTCQELYPDDPDLATLFYKMVKGTKKWDIEKNLGIPPFENFFCLDTKVKTPIHFHFASKPLLIAVFGKSAAQEILEVEQGKWTKDHKHHSLTKQELATLLANPSSFAKAEPHLNFSKKQSRLQEITGTDKASGITVKKHL